PRASRDIRFLRYRVVISISEAGRTRKAGLRIHGEHLDQAAGGVASEQSALRTLRHLDLRDVVERERREAGGTVIDAIDIQRHRILDARTDRSIADAANVRYRSALRLRH